MNRHPLQQEEDYQETELGLLPKDWEVAKLRDFIQLETGRRMKGGALAKGDVPSIGGEHIDNEGRVVWDKQMKYISKDFYDSLKHGKVLLNDILIVKDGATTGKVAFLNKLNTTTVATNEHVFIIRSMNMQRLLNHFLFYFLFSEEGQRQIRLNYHGIIGGIKREDIFNLIVPVPSFLEQQEIASLLSTVQQAREKTEQVINSLKDLKKSLMKYLFTYGAVGLEDAERIQMKETEIGTIPKDWNVSSLKDIATLQRGKDLPKQEWKKGNVPIIGSSGIMGYHEEAVCEGPGVITGRSGSIGKVTYIERDYWPHNTALYVKDFHENDTKFVYYLMQTLDFEKYATGVSVPTLNRNFIHMAKKAVPPLAAQQEIAFILFIVDSNISCEENKKEALGQLFKSTLYNLMSAKIRVKNFGG